MTEPTPTVKGPPLQDSPAQPESTGCAATDSSATPDLPRSPLTTTPPSQSFDVREFSTAQGNELPQLAWVGDGQCTGLRGQLSTGGQVGDRGPRWDGSGVPYPEDERGTQRVPKKPFRFDNILNPLETQALDSEERGAPPTAQPSDAGVPSATLGLTPGPFSTCRSTSFPVTPVGPITPLSEPSSAHNSPTTEFTSPAANQPLQPMSLDHGLKLARVSDPSMQPSLPSPPLFQQPYGFEAPEEPRSQSSGLPHYLTAVLPRPLSSLPTPGGSFSQPAFPPPEAQAPPDFPPSNALGHQRPTGVPSEAFCPPNKQMGQPFPSAHLPPENAALEWYKAQQTHNMGSGFLGVVEQQAFMALPGSDTPISVRVDYSQASKKADEKRHRNAVASTKFRRKKKIRHEELEKRNQALETENEELTKQLAVCRGEHERLRNLVLHTPSIAHLAGPSSPTPPTSNEYAEIGGLAIETQGSLLAHGYGGDSSSGERLAKRRRIDENPDLSIPAYEPPANGHSGRYPNRLPPVQGMPDTGYGGPS